MAAKRNGPGGPAAGPPGEVRAPATVAALAGVALYLTLPNELLGIARYVIPGIEVALLVALVAANPVRMTRDNVWLRRLSLLFVALVCLANAAAFVVLIDKLVTGKAEHGTALLLAALQVWLTNIIGFALAYWELDRGGPVVRSTSARADLPAADWRFSQDEDDDAAREVAVGSSKSADWRARFVDYFYVSVTNSTAFSPTDTMPLSPRAKLLMSAQSIEALLLSVLVIARGVSLLK